jgi:hypothetical protein
LHKHFSEVLDKQHHIRENLKNEVCQAGYIEIRLPLETLLSTIFDPMNITTISDSMVYHKRSLILSANERFKLSMSGIPAITQVTPRNMFAVKKVMIPIPEKMEVLFNNREINELPEKD